MHWSHPTTDFEFTNCFLVEEVIGSPDQEPSLALGTTRQQIFAEYDLEKSTPMPKVHWMLELLRTTTFTRYTGTLRHPDLRGKLGSSILVFVHYAFAMSSEDLLFADIQGEYCQQIALLKLTKSATQDLWSANPVDHLAMFCSTWWATPQMGK